MNRTRLITTVFFCFAAFLSSPRLFANESQALGRYALIIGSNDGGQTRVRLKYATSDASSFSLVLQEMGGLTPVNQVLLLDPVYDEVIKGFSRVDALIRQSGQSNKRNEFIVYYSGHSDEEGLLIRGRRLPYADLRKLIGGVPADVRIAIIDSCASGVFIRSKGGTKQPAFIVDSSNDMKGYAFLTSSSETEAAQESDRINASFFTHHFVGGLRGAADVTQDGIVTLNEAYHYAFTETLATTEKTQFGPQHPSYDIQLTGTGDLVLTDLRQTTSGLVFEEKIDGRISIRDRTENLVVELKKNPGIVMEIGISPGEYTVLLESGSTLKLKEINVGAGSRTRLTQRDFTDIPAEATTRRGPDGELDPIDPTESETVYRPFSFSVLPSPIASGDHQAIVTNIALFLTIDSCDILSGVSAGVVGMTVRGELKGAMMSGIYNISEGDTSGALLSGIFNLTHGETRGFLSSSIFNWSSAGTTGVQTAGIFNYSEASVSGVQIAGLFNYSTDIDGVQIAGGLNSSASVHGAQIGLVNIAKNVHGVQVGLINIAEENSGVAVGLFNYSKDGIHNFEAWVDQDMFSSLGFKFGTKYFYTILLGGYNFTATDELWQFGIGWGFRLPIDKFFFDIDATLTSMHSRDLDWSTSFEKTLLPHIRLKAGIQLLSFVGIFAGVDFQFHSPDLYYDPSIVNQAIFEFSINSSGSETCKVVPRFFLGVQLLD